MGRACDVVFLAVSGDFAEEWAEKIAEGDDGALVIDNSSAFRYTDGIPLVVPEINADAARKSDKKLIANPNCTTAIALMALAPLHKEFGIKRCIMSTYQEPPLVLFICRRARTATRLRLLACSLHASHPRYGSILTSMNVVVLLRRAVYNEHFLSKK